MSGKGKSKWFNTTLAENVYVRTYAKYLPDKKRRENWEETVDRVIDFMAEKAKAALDYKEYDELRKAILEMKVFPSMRCIFSAGDMARSDNTSIFNCSYMAIDNTNCFATALLLLMNGAGVGFSVERKFTDQLPAVAEYKEGSGVVTVVFEDSREGWSKGFNDFVEALWNGYDADYNLSHIRPKGSILKKSGGRASGPEPLKRLLDFTKNILVAHRGRKLSPINCHDIMCMCGEVVVCGGVRRSAEISLSDLGDTQMRDAKVGAFWNNHPYRSMANNSAVYLEKPNGIEFMKEFTALAASGTGERGIFNREGAQKSIPERRKKASDYSDFGANPCCEIILRSKQFCNLSTVIVRPDDTLGTLKEKVRYAAILGTIQSSMTDFGKLLLSYSEDWKKNTEEEALLGVSLCGIMDAPHLFTPENMQELRKVAVNTNEEYASRLRINPSKSVCCIKPEGTSSLTAGPVASGFHARYAPYYIRRVRFNGDDPLYRLMKDQGVQFKPEVGSTEENAHTWVAEFPVKSPEGAICASELSALDQLEWWKKVKINWAEHTVSATVTVADDEWMEVGDWILKNWDHVTGISFLNKSTHAYELAPLEEITKEQYEAMLEEVVEVDYSRLGEYEEEDHTQGSHQNIACVGGQCEI